GLIDAIEGFIVLMVDHAPDPDDLPPVGKNVPADTREIIETARAEMLLARGNSAAALGVLEPLGQTTSTFALGRSSAEPWAIFLEGRLDEALDKALSLMTVARREFDVEGIVGSAYVAAQVYLTRGRTPELRALLGSVLSAGVLPPLQRPQHVALLSIAATLAAEEGRHATARTLAQQALALQTGPGAWPLGSPTQAIAHLDAADLPPAQAHAQAAEKLWTEAVTLVDKGYLASGYTAGMLAVVEEPTKDRGKTMAKWLKQLDAPVFRQLGLMVTALCDGDPEKLITAAEHLANAGYVWQATRAYAAGLAALRSSGGAARAAEVHEDARRRLEQWGPQAAAGLRSAAEGAELTAREDEIARLAASGMSNQEIARRLLISVRTVENHLHRVFRKLGVENRAEMSRVIQG
ncbi:MAG: helix-turn-helix transcriptional regulator, partial [Cellulomonadaceae bacterium]|nr:helix-turn-helix transcriptional regulator [Cellulomonadaceae bacterium]